MTKDVVDILSNHGNLKPNQYIEGRLFLTLEQWYLIVEHEPFMIQPFSWFAFRAEIVKDDKIFNLPGGRVLVYSKDLDSFNVFDEEVARATGMIE